VLFVIVLSGCVIPFVAASSHSVTYFSVTEDKIGAGDSFDYLLDNDQTAYVVIDVDGDGNYSDGDLKDEVTNFGEGTFPSSKTEFLDGKNDTYDVYAIETNSLSENDSLPTEFKQSLIVDGTTPFITNPNLTNPVDQDLNISFNSSEQLESATVELTRSSTTVETYTKSDLDTQTVDGSYQYNTTYTGSSDGDYTVEITKAEDAVGNDAAGNQTEGLSDSVTVETTPVEITSVEAEVGSNTVKVTFNESVVNSTDEGLSPEDLSYTNESGDGAGTITAIDHTAESDTATVTLDAAVSRTGLGNDTIAPVDGRVTDRFDNPALRSQATGYYQTGSTH